MLPPSENLITKQKAKEIALSHAGVKEADIRDYEIEIDREAGKTVYEISFDSGNFEYEYELNAISGKILQSERERID
ncbi:MAG: PepSY domain-containing protein [Clostridia bacterium]|nr:PepSY domain-containing protein [Clostridia bacterium]